MNDLEGVATPVATSDLIGLLRACADAHTAVWSLRSTPGDDVQAEALLAARIASTAVMESVTEMRLGVPIAMIAGHQGYRAGGGSNTLWPCAPTSLSPSP